MGAGACSVRDEVLMTLFGLDALSAGPIIHAEIFISDVRGEGVPGVKGES
jgi:hypothetical protein